MDSVIILGSIAITAIIYAIYTAWRLQLAREDSAKKLEEMRVYYEKNKNQSSNTQRAVIKGQLAEQFYPLTDRCQYHPSDMRFLGMPIDYIIFDGYTECKDEGGHINEIIFAEIKSGSSQLSRHQREIRDAVISGRVRWETINV